MALNVQFLHTIGDTVRFPRRVECETLVHTEPFADTNALFEVVQLFHEFQWAGVDVGEILNGLQHWVEALLKCLHYLVVRAMLLCERYGIRIYP